MARQKPGLDFQRCTEMFPPGPSIPSHFKHPRISACLAGWPPRGSSSNNSWGQTTTYQWLVVEGFGRQDQLTTRSKASSCKFLHLTMKRPQVWMFWMITDLLSKLFFSSSIQYTFDGRHQMILLIAPRIWRLAFFWSIFAWLQEWCGKKRRNGGTQRSL